MVGAAVVSPPRTDEFPFETPTPVTHPLLVHEWSELSLVHWRYRAPEVQALLPAGVRVDEFDGSAWVGLVPFHCTIRPRGFPRVPWLSSFPEINVRTYVRGPNGEPAVWFVTLDAARLGAVLIARAAYGLEYCWAQMRFERRGDVATYAARRRWPVPKGAHGSMSIAIGDRYQESEIDELTRWLTNRWRFYCTTPLGLATGLVDHPRWPLRHAELLDCDPGLLGAAGLPDPSGTPLAHYGGTVEVRMSRPYLVHQI